MAPFNIHTSASLENIPYLRSESERWLYHMVDSADLKENVLTALSEITSNIVKHGNPKAKQIRVLMFQESSKLYLEIYDDGGEFSNFTEYLAEISTVELGNMFQTSGMGLKIVTSLFPEISYQPKSLINSSENIMRVNIANLEFSAQKKIMVIDDDISLLALVNSYLMEEYNIVTFENAKSALKYVENNPVDLIISDINMPSHNGLQLRDQLSNQRNNALLPFIFLSGSHDSSIREAALGLGVDDFLVKPINKEQLQTVIKRVLNRNAQIQKNQRQVIDDEITNALRPSLPKIAGGFRISVTTRSASVGGGDFVLFEPGQKKDCFVLGDIMGHGEQAKFFVHAYAGFFEGLGQSIDQKMTPGEMLSRLSVAADTNSLLSKTLVTCISVELVSNGKLRIANAGHPPPLLILPDKIVEVGTVGGLPGLNAASSYEDIEVNLEDNRILFYTDGLLESAPDEEGRFLLESTIKNMLRQTRNLSIEDANKALIQHIDQVSEENGKLFDDVTIIMMESEH